MIKILDKYYDYHCCCMAEERATDEVGHGGTSDVDVKEMLLTIAEEMLLEVEVPALDLARGEVTSACVQDGSRVAMLM